MLKTCNCGQDFREPALFCADCGSRRNRVCQLFNRIFYEPVTPTKIIVEDPYESRSRLELVGLKNALVAGLRQKIKLADEISRLQHLPDANLFLSELQDLKSQYEEYDKEIKNTTGKIGWLLRELEVMTRQNGDISSAIRGLGCT